MTPGIEIRLAEPRRTSCRDLTIETPMKILQINTMFAPDRYGGAEIFLERLSERLVDHGHEVVVACLSPEPTTQPPAPVRVEQFRLRNIYWPFDGVRRPRWLKAVWHLRNSFGRGSATDVARCLQRERPDLVHTHNLTGFTSAVWNTIRAAKIPLFHTLHDYALLCPSHDDVPVRRVLSLSVFDLPLDVVVESPPFPRGRRGRRRQPIRARSASGRRLFSSAPAST